MKDQIDYLVEAIRLLKPNSEFVLTNDDYSTIKWNVLEGKAPTQKQINDAIEQIKANDINKAEAKIVQRQLILDKLGLTVDEARLLLG
jgi:hypothetical protein